MSIEIIRIERNMKQLNLMLEDHLCRRKAFSKILTQVINKKRPITDYMDAEESAYERGECNGHNNVRAIIMKLNTENEETITRIQHQLNKCQENYHSLLEN